MNKTVVLSSLGNEFFGKWKYYKKLLRKSGIKDWTICSDYCVDDKNKFDSILRIPDIITGTLSSISSKDGVVFAEKEKHKDIFCDAIYNNPRTFIIYYIWDKIYGHKEFVVLNHP